ncbi:MULTISPECIES: class I SAM-dependent DNA methyltransferase [unclassified Streptococcus]|uniref:HsdM family class I SAM-dependent methyltransferase n=1 Tax=unclassified Streptococcus TaxID=2608887 RepID=UPI001071E3D6|nr:MULTISPECIES: N-6 DNA methylase [unclassified Streptococcus]MBF0806253.1 N-6 DNA methylase [Streptococcus sp. 19428wA2_WM07]TFU28163.1 SAM-dependent DNA methyltransferase [Streptococcus sp. WM07]
MNWKLETDVNDWVKSQFARIGLEKHRDYNEESGMSDYLKEALKGSAKTATKTNFGIPDLHIEKYKLPVLIENKLGLKKLVSETKDGIKTDDKSKQAFAVNGALHYSRSIIDSGKYSEVIAIGIAGDNAENVAIKVYYVFGSAPNAYKSLDSRTSLDFLETKKSFDVFYKEAILTEEEKHRILIDSQATLQSYAKKLNRLMHNHNITAPQRVLYVSGMLLAMQDVVDKNGHHVDDGLTPDDLKGVQSDTKRDGKKVVDQIKAFLDERAIDKDKQKLMLSSFQEISKDPQRDEVTENDKEVAKLIDGSSSVTKQIFTFIYEYIFKSIDGLGAHIDIMGEMYSEFLKYALGDGKEIGIVLTPPYVTKMMAQILGIDEKNKVMDLATGSAGFLISAMELMVEATNLRYGKGTTQAEKTILELKKNNLLGIELNAEMYTLATTNMILRGDGSSRIEKGSAFNRPENLFTDFEADRLLLNPPFSHDENGLPFIAYGLDKMKKGGLGAIIIQDSAGSGKAIKTAKSILSKHTLLASIKMPVDLFVPMAGVQTSVYIFKAHTKHDFEKTVKFIDFRNDGYKRAKRGVTEIDSPTERYQDVIKIYKAGKRAKISADWDLEATYIEDFITNQGNDWNFEQHQIIDTKPTLEDFKKTVADYLSWEVTQLLQQKGEDTSKKA